MGEAAIKRREESLKAGDRRDNIKNIPNDNKNRVVYKNVYFQKSQHIHNNNNNNIF